MKPSDWILHKYLLARILVREHLNRAIAMLPKGEEGSSAVEYVLITFGVLGVILLIFAIFQGATNKGRVVLDQIEGLRQPYP